MFHTLIYDAAAATAGATNFEASAAVTDGTFSTRGTTPRFIFTEPMVMLANYAVGASLTRGRIRSSQLTAYGEHAIALVNRSATPPANAMGNYWLDLPIPLPQEEEMIVELSNNLGAATEDEVVLINVAPKSWTANLPRGDILLTARTSQSVTGVLDAWSAETALTFDQALRGGWWAVVGARCQVAAATAFRLIFPRQPMSPGGKYLKPGGLCINAVGNAEPNTLDRHDRIWGPWGQFHTSELPRIQTFATTAGAQTAQLWLDVVYQGGSAYTTIPGL